MKGLNIKGDWQPRPSLRLKQSNKLISQVTANNAVNLASALVAMIAHGHMIQTKRGNPKGEAPVFQRDTQEENIRRVSRDGPQG